MMTVKNKELHKNDLDKLHHPLWIPSFNDGDNPFSYDMVH
jgi:hypothetical protein